jgi:hypothetical protein
MTTEPTPETIPPTPLEDPEPEPTTPEEDAPEGDDAS